MTTDTVETITPAITDIAIPDYAEAGAALNHVLATGDVSRMSDAQKCAFYLDLCQSAKLNPRPRPFDFIEFWDPETRAKKLTLYPNHNCSDQLAVQWKIRTEVIDEQIVGTLFKVVMKGTDPDGRYETNVAYVDLLDKEGKRLTGQRLGDRYMKAHTKAKRRLILGMCGLKSTADIEDLEHARVVVVDGLGRVIANPTAEQKALAADPGQADVIGEPTYEKTAAGTASPLASAPTIAPTDEDLAGPERPYRPPTSFRCNAARWQRAWFELVKDSFLDTDDDRHDFLEWYTANLPPQRRTRSLPAFLAAATDRQAQALIDQARETIAMANAAAAEAAEHADDQRPYEEWSSVDEGIDDVEE